MNSTEQKITAYDLGEEGEQWMVEGTQSVELARSAVFALWAEQGLEAEYRAQLDGLAMSYKSSPGWWYEPVSADAPDDESWLRGVALGSPAPYDTETFPGVLVSV